MNWYIEVLKKYAVFDGRARRKEFWFFVLFNLIISFALAIVDSAVGSSIGDANVGFLGGIYSLAVLIPSIAVTVRRLHDTERSGWWVLLSLVPFGVIVVLVFALIEGTAGPNKYGEDPKGRNAASAGAPPVAPPAPPPATTQPPVAPPPTTTQPPVVPPTTTTQPPVVPPTASTTQPPVVPPTASTTQPPVVPPTASTTPPPPPPPAEAPASPPAEAPAPPVAEAPAPSEKPLAEEPLAEEPPAEEPPAPPSVSPPTPPPLTPPPLS